MDRLLKYATLMYAGIILIGYISEYLYFSFFGVKINEYYTISDLLLGGMSIIMSNFILILLFCILTIILFFSSANWIRDAIRLRFFERHQRKFNWFSSTCGIIGAIIFSYQLNDLYIFNGDLLFERLVPISLIALVTILVVLIYGGFLINRNIYDSKAMPVPAKNLKRLDRFSTEYFLNYLYNKKVDLIIVCIYSIFLTVTSFQEISTAESIIVDSQHNKYITFKYEDTLIKSTDSTFWVGATNAYIFVYRSNNRSTSVYERSKISDINYFTSLKALNRKNVIK